MAEEKEALSNCAYFWYYCMLFFGYWFGASRLDEHRDRDFDPSDVEAYFTDRNFLWRNFQVSKTARLSLRALCEGKGEADAEAVAHKVADGRFNKQGFPWFMLFECAVCFLLWACLAAKISAQDGSTNPWFLKAGLDTIDDGMLDLRLSNTSCQDYRWQLWRWLTYQWTHVGAWHVVINSLLLIMFAVPLEGLYGSYVFAWIFNIGVFCGACCYFVTDAHTALVGCSGGIYMLLGIHVADFCVTWHQKKFRIFTVLLICALIALDALCYNLSVSAEYNSHSPHVGGTIAGFIIGVLLNRSKKMTLYEKVLMGVLALIGCALVIFSIVWLIVHRAPLNIWEAMQGHGGYCWIRQVFNPRINPNAWQCVRCGTQDCIACWSKEPYLEIVSMAACNQQGYINNVPAC